MPAKRKRKARDDEGPEAPPLPDEPLPPLEEEPPLPDEEPPPLPDEDVPDEEPPLPAEPVPSSSEDSDATQLSKSTSREPETSALVQTTAPPVPEPEPDAWQAIWDSTANAYYFYNPETKETTWLNPRLPPHEAEAALAANPPILDPTALPKERPPDDIYNPETGEYGFTARFNARTGKFQNNPEHTAENFSTLGQIMRTSHDYFDVSQMQKGEIVGQSGGRLKADRKAQMNAMSGKQRKQFVEKMKKKKDQKKREWYADDDIIVRKH